MSDAELVRLQLHRNDWFVRHARRLLQERASSGTLDRRTEGDLVRILDRNPDVTRKLRALWALHAIGRLDEFRLVALLKARDENPRWWSVQLLCENRRPAPDVLKQFAAMARSDPSPMARLALASALQRLPLRDRWPIADGLLAHADDSADQNLPLMLWYAVEPLVPADRARATRLMANAKIPLVRQFIARRLAEN